MNFLLILYSCLLGIFIPKYFFLKSDLKKIKKDKDIIEEVIKDLILCDKLNYQDFFKSKESMKKYFERNDIK